jgi:hypothetical protein
MLPRFRSLCFHVFAFVLSAARSVLIIALLLLGLPFALAGFVAQLVALGFCVLAAGLAGRTPAGQRMASCPMLPESMPLRDDDKRAAPPIELLEGDPRFEQTDFHIAPADAQPRMVQPPALPPFRGLHLVRERGEA